MSARAGHELFGEPSDLTIDVTLRRDAGADSYLATLGLPGASGRATRELRSTVGCGELATAAALVVSIALDPEAVDCPSAEAFQAAVSARAGYIIDAGRLRFRASLEGDVVAPRTSFVVNDTSVYTTRGVSLSAGLDALLFF